MVIDLKRLFALMTFMIILFSIPSVVLAVDYSIESMEIDVQLKQNGDAFVTETQTYHFDSSFNGITRTLKAKEGSRIIDYEAKEKGEPLQVEFEEGMYKIYRAGKASETVTVVSTYTIKDAVELYKDAGQFYWSFFDNNNPSAYENLKITIHPPVPSSDTVSIGYQRAENKEKVLDDGSVQFQIGYVPSETSADVRVAFDRSVFSGVNKVEESPIKPEILGEIKKREEKRQAFEERKEKLASSSNMILGAFGIILLLLLFIVWQRKQATKMEVAQNYVEPFFVPEEIMSVPATIFYNSGIKIINTEVLSAALFDLVRQGYVTQTEDETFKVVKDNATREHERHLIEWLFYKVGKDGVFSSDYLKDYTDKKSNASTYQNDYHQWDRLVREEIKSHQLFKKVTSFRVGLGILAILLIGLVIQYFIHDLIIQGLFGIFLSLCFIVFALSYRPRTAKGLKIKQDWDNFLQKYVSFEEKDWDKLHSDDQRRAFLYSAGVVNHEITKKNDELLNKDPLENYGVANPMYFLLFATMFHGHFDTAHASSTTSSTSSFSSTSIGGGVGGSGGGSGAF